VYSKDVLHQDCIHIDIKYYSCNCRVNPYSDGGDCHQCTSVYKVTCHLCNKFYVGVTKNSLKDVRSLVLQNQSGVSFARRFAQHCVRDQIPPTQLGVHVVCSFGYVWKGQALTALKSVGKLASMLCQKECLTLWKASCIDPDHMMNTSLVLTSSVLTI